LSASVNNNRSRSAPVASVPSHKIEKQRERRKSLLSKVDDEYLAHRLDHSWQLSLETKLKLAKWLQQDLRVSTGSRIHLLMQRNIAGAAGGHGNKRADFITVRIGNVSERGSPAGTGSKQGANTGPSYPEISNESAIDLNMEEYIAAIINYDKNLDPYVAQQHDNVGLFDKIISGGGQNRFDADAIDKVSIAIALGNEWRNGVFLSELLANAVMKGQDKDTIKEVCSKRNDNADLSCCE
jgi:hypothetical protein